MSTDASPFFVESEKICFGPSLLNEIAPFVKRKKSTTRVFVEKCLCENMTDFESVMFFDRELIYRTQEEEDAIGFVNVSEVAKSSPEGKLPQWEASYASHAKEPKNQDAYSEVLSTMTVNKTPNNKFTYKPSHRITNLTLKHLYGTGQMNQLIKTTDEEASTPLEQKALFTEKLENILDISSYQVKDFCHPIIQRNGALAQDVYHEKHPFTKLCRNQKRMADQTPHSQEKRQCMSY